MTLLKEFMKADVFVNNQVVVFHFVFSEILPQRKKRVSRNIFRSFLIRIDTSLLSCSNFEG